MNWLTPPSRLHRAVAAHGYQWWPWLLAFIIFRVLQITLLLGCLLQLLHWTLR